MPEAQADRAALLANWRQLAAKVDAFFASAQARNPGAMACRAGCVACCQQELTVLPVEALAITSALEQLPAPEREAIARDAAGEGPPCAFLGPNGGCRVYASRPLVCRTHGLPIRQRPLEGPAAGQESVSVCDLNFTDGDIPPAALLDGTTLLATLTVIDDLLRQQLGTTDCGRTPLRDLARGG